MPVNGPITGYSVYEAGENRMPYSEDFSQWSFNVSPNESSVTTGAVTAYDGVTLADKIFKPNGVTGLLSRYKIFTGAVSTTYIGGIVLKAVEISNVSVYFGNSSFNNINYGIRLSLTTGAFYDYVNNTYPVNYRIESLGNGWYRIIVQATSDADGGNYVFAVNGYTSGWSQTVVGTDNGFYATQGEVQTGNIDSYTPYVKTTATAIFTTKSVQDLGNRYVSKAYATDVYQSLAPSKKSGGLWTWGYNFYGEIGNGFDNNSYGGGIVFPTRIGTLVNYEQVASNFYTLLMLKTDGTLWGTGYNASGELGTNSRTHRSSPFQIGALTDWKQVGVGQAAAGYAAGIKETGTLWVWGDNSSGQLGTNSLTHRSSPFQVGTLTNWKQVFCGSYSTFAIKNDSTLWAWGDNSGGTLGVGDTVHRSSPTQVGSDTNWKQISNWGAGYTIGVKLDGTMWAIGGGNANGELGLGLPTNIFISTPVQIGALTSWVQCSAGSSAVYGLKSDGTLWGWGSNNYGGSPALNMNLYDTLPVGYYSSPLQIGSATNWKRIYPSGAGYNGGYAINAMGELYASGGSWHGVFGYVGPMNDENYSQGQNYKAFTHNAVIRDGYYDSTVESTNIQFFNVPYTFSSSSSASDYNNSFEETFAKLDNFIDTGLFSWGFNTDGRLGVNDLVHRSSPTQIGSLTNWKEIAGSGASTFGTKTDSTLWAWGSATAGALGTGNLTHRSSPTQIGSQNRWTLVTGYGGTGYAVQKQSYSSDFLYGWGNNAFGQLGQSDTTNRSSPVQIYSQNIWVSISAGDGYITGLDSLGFRWTCGNNSDGQFGDGTATNQTIMLAEPDTNILYEGQWVYLAGSGKHSNGIKTTGTLWSWGNNADGRLGLNDLVHRSSPTQIGALTTWKQVSSSGTAHTLAIKKDGTLWAWGLNTNGRLGLNDLVHRSSPVQVGSLTNWKEVQCGDSYTIALKTDGTFWGWGINTNGQLGSNTITHRSSPFQIGTATGWKRISAGNNHAIAILSPDLP